MSTSSANAQAAAAPGSIAASSRSNAGVWWFAPAPLHSFCTPVNVSTPGQSCRYALIDSEAIHGAHAASESMPRFRVIACLASAAAAGWLCTS